METNENKKYYTKIDYYIPVSELNDDTHAFGFNLLKSWLNDEGNRIIANEMQKALKCNFNLYVNNTTVDFLNTLTDTYDYFGIDFNGNKDVIRRISNNIKVQFETKDIKNFHLAYSINEKYKKINKEVPRKFMKKVQNFKFLNNFKEYHKLLSSLNSGVYKNINNEWYKYVG